MTSELIVVLPRPLHFFLVALDRGWPHVHMQAPGLDCFTFRSAQIASVGPDLMADDNKYRGLELYSTKN